MRVRDRPRQSKYVCNMSVGVCTFGAYLLYIVHRLACFFALYMMS